MAKDIATARPGSRVLGIGAVDVRNVDSLQKSIDTCVKELGGIDFLMSVFSTLESSRWWFFFCFWSLHKSIEADYSFCFYTQTVPGRQETF